MRQQRRVILGFDDFSALRKRDRKSTRLNSSHVSNSYAVFCLKKKTAPTAIALMASPQLAIHKFQATLDPGRQSLHERDDRLTMRRPQRSQGQCLLTLNTLSER